MSSYLRYLPAVLTRNIWKLDQIVVTLSIGIAVARLSLENNRFLQAPQVSNPKKY
jgi:hypothetical protein